MKKIISKKNKSINPEIKIREQIIESKNDSTERLIEKKEWIVLGLIMVCASFTHFYNLDFQTLWVDEYVHAGVARKFLNNNGSMFGWELNQMFINILNCVFVAVFGMNDFVLRLPVALLSLIGVPAIFALTKKITQSKYAGYMSALFFIASQFLIFWSRIDRAYGLIPSIYLCVLLMFWLMVNEKNNTKIQWKFFNFFNWHPTYFLWLCVVYFIAFITQIQVFLFFISVGFYYSFLFFERFFLKQKRQHYLDGIAILNYVNISAFVLLFTPLADTLMRPLISTFLPTKMVDLIIPNWASLKIVLSGKDWAKNFITYWNLTTTDLHYFYFIGWAGFILAFVYLLRSAYFLFSFFIVPMLLMGFILREPNWAKYMSFYYPLFFVAGVISLMFLYQKVILKFFAQSNFFITYKRILMGGSFFILFYIVTPFQTIKYFITTDDYVSIIDPRLAEVSFPPWKKDVQYILENMQPDDIIISTLPDPVVHYAGLENVIQFRQNTLDGKKREWVQMTLTPEMLAKDNAYSLEELKKTFKKNKRGWFFADYYINNISCDIQAKQFVFDSMEYHFEQNTEGQIKIFSWDHSSPKKTKTPLLYELGKKYSNIRPIEPLKFNIPQEYLKIKNNQITLRLTCEGIDHSQEAAVVVNNNQKQIFIPVAEKPIVVNNIKMFQPIKGIQTIDVFVDKNSMKVGNNIVTFLHSENSNGYVIYNCEFIFN